MSTNTKEIGKIVSIILEKNQNTPAYHLGNLGGKGVSNDHQRGEFIISFNTQKSRDQKYLKSMRVCRSKPEESFVIFGLIY